ncbi:tyrosine-type recombinase/integrase [Parvularcula lutaonensis]|uniref:Tyrosine-type recombinase/integrase n=1 Tax=Parvularcula lutaonensis TaxID=491923 RepID=A0ABV7M6U7_9PROT|nr:integrase arm-type DNA-binding domain-containing protein [Parvularcula lutaonensis]GGY56659.1 hypothetical protein GCM10007148_27820 [Parvularcula lutaonensis]
MQLTDTQIKRAKPKDKQYRMADGQGLHLLVKPNGSKLWQLRYWVSGKEKTLSIGQYPVITLAQAREKRLEAKRTLADGLDPSTEKRPAKDAAVRARTDTFNALVSDFMAKQVREGRAERTLQKNRWLLSMAVDDFGSAPLTEITAPLILKTLRKVEARGNYETAHRLRSIIGTVFRYGVATGVASSDPTYASWGHLPDLAGHTARLSLNGRSSADCYGPLMATRASVRHCLLSSFWRC